MKIFSTLYLKYSKAIIFSNKCHIPLCLPFLLFICFIDTVHGQKYSFSKTEIILPREVSADTMTQDSRPLISPDGKQLFFGRRHYQNNAGNKRDFQDIWVAELDGAGRYFSVQNLGKQINNTRSNGIYSINPEGNEIIVTNDYDNTRIAPIAKSVKKNGVWSKPTPIIIEDFYNKSLYVDFYLSHEHKVLLIAAERNNRSGDQDIFICFPNEKGDWLKPIRLGTSINSKSADFAPFLSSDGKTLFFSSFREGGLGGSDIYAATRLDDSWINWSEPVNLGESVNTPGNEDYCSVTSNMEYIFVESVSKETKKHHLFKVEIPKEVKHLNKTLYVSSK